MATTTFKSIRPHPEEDGGISFVPLRNGFVVPRRFTARNEQVLIDIELDGDGTPRVRAITILGDDIKSETLRRLPVGKLTRVAVFEASRKMDDGVFRLVSTPQDEAAAFYSAYVQDARPPRKGSPVTDERLREVATRYRAAVERGDPPTQTIGDEMHASRPTAARWVQKARERGFLGPAVPGRAGEAI
jgi:Family of unknown function (DUF6214)